ncbi:MAG TPA: ABC transporter permease [Chloroflexota bacterium]|nr:ABC transporter permease [Chloroflexota bacterium]
MGRSIIRTLSFFSQWASEVLRQPWLMIVLVLGPFVVLFLFGAGESVGAPKPRAIIVVPAGQQQSPLAVSTDNLTQYLQVVATTTDLQGAREQLANNKADLVVVIPPDPLQAIQNGQHANIQVLTDEIDPVRLSYAQAYIRQQGDALNRQTVEKAVATAQGQIGDVHSFLAEAQNYVKALQSSPDLASSQADLGQIKSELDQVSNVLHTAIDLVQNSPLILFNGVGGTSVSQLQQTAKSVDDLRSQISGLQSQLSSAGLPSSLTPQDLQQLQTSLNQIDQQATQLRTIPPDVVASPFNIDIQNIAPWKPNGTGFYAPALLALIVQHVGITLGALSMSRVRLLGLMEILQTSPVKATEISVGNFLAYGTLCVLVAGTLMGLIMGVLGVPVFGPPWAVVAVLLLLIAASVGIGLVVSLVSASEQQAVQVAMLVLIASVFFSGFLVSLDTIDWPIRIISFLLPVTYAIRTLDDVMLRGRLLTPEDFGILAAFAVVFFLATIFLFRREMRAR